VPQFSITKGALYIVATPIGNLDDLTVRAREVLSQVDLIAAEDTRHSAPLLSAIGARARLISLHEHNEQQRAGPLLEELRRGAAVALISDAGTPLISDPGFTLVRAATESGIRVIPVPGPCAAIAALSVAGLPTDRFLFEGFLAAKSARRREHLQTLQREPRSLIFYESPHRCIESLNDMAEVLGGERKAMVARELTKAFETCYYGALRELAEQASRDSNMSRGELVIVVAGNPIEASLTEISAERVLRALMEELPVAQAAKLAARITGASRAELYELAIQSKQAAQIDKEK
jgi:16S rRNA (cytidine1402-2'-O)-methyltransferase